MPESENINELRDGLDQLSRDCATMDLAQLREAVGVLCCAVRLIVDRITVEDDDECRG